MAQSLKTLDLSEAPERPTVKLPDGEYEMLLSEELTFEQFAQQQSMGARISELAVDVSEEGSLEELQTLIARGAQLILVDLPDDVAAIITPGQFLRISSFFRALTAEGTEQPVSGIGKDSAQDANGSTEPPEDS